MIMEELSNKEIIEVDKRYIIKKLMEKKLPVEKQQKVYCKITGQPRRSYFNKKKELLEKCKSAEEKKYSYVDEQLKAIEIEI